MLLCPHVYTSRKRSLGTRYSSVLQWEQENGSGTFPINSLPWSRAGSQSGLVSSAHKLSLRSSLQIFICFNIFFLIPLSMRSDLICLFVLCHCLSQAIFSLNPKSLHFAALQYCSKCVYVGGVPLGDFFFFFFVLYSLHKNRQKFHKKEEEGILLFETKIIPAAKICCLLPPRNY